MATAALTRYTPEEYLALERHAEFRSEYIDGRIIAMSPGGSAPHNFIGGNIYVSMVTRLAGRTCHVFIYDMKVRFGHNRDYTYPDVMAVCGTPHYEDGARDILTNPSLIVEVLSPSTKGYDRGKKFEGYKAVPSLREYVLVWQDEVRVEFHTREGDFWVRSEETDLDATIELPSVGCTFTLREIYNRTRFVEEPAPGHR